MTAVRPAPTPAAPAPEAVPGPTPRRVRPPRWLDLRLVLGLLLVLGSVLLGARVVAAADATVPVWSAAGDLAAGTVLSAEDLVPVDVRLDDVARAYLATSTRPAGRTLARAVRAGELLPGSALAEPQPLVQLALPVQAGYVPPGLQRGQLVDVYAVADPAAGATGRDDEAVTRVVASAPVQALSGRTEGVLSTPTTTVQVVVSVAAGRADDVLAAIGGRPLVVVVHDSVDSGDAPTASAPAPAPGPASSRAASDSASGAASGAASAAPSRAPSAAPSGPVSGPASGSASRAAPAAPPRATSGAASAAPSRAASSTASTAPSAPAPAAASGAAKAAEPTG